MKALSLLPLALLLIVTAHVGQTERVSAALLETESCDAYNLETLFPPLPSDVGSEKDTVDSWTERYHSRVNAIVEELLQKDAREPMCSADTDTSLLPAPAGALQLASELPPWNTRERILVAREETSLVLLSYLRGYQCALLERSLVLNAEIVSDALATESVGLPSQERVYDLFAEYTEQRAKIQFELQTARPALQSTLRVLSGLQRFDALDAQTVCIERATLDAHNAVALGAEAMSCLPRIWDSRDPLRDLPQNQ